MPRLVQNTHQSAGKVTFVVARGDAHIRRHAATKRMVAGVEAPVREIKAHRLHEAQPELSLSLGREGTLRNHDLVVLLSLDHLFGETRQKRAEVREQNINVRAAHARLKAIDQGVIGRQLQNLSKRRGHLLLQRDYGF